MLWKCCTQYSSTFGKLSSGHRTGKGQFSFQSQRKAMPKNIQTTATITLISHASKIMLKILQGRLQQYVNHELPDVQAGFSKGRGTRNQIANIHWIMDKVREFQKNCFIDYTKAFDCVKVTHSCPTLYDPMDYTVHGILKSRILEWIAILFSRGSSQPRDGTQVSRIAGRFFTSWATGKPIWLGGLQQSGKFLKRWEYQTTLPVSWETLCGSRSNC